MTAPHDLQDATPGPWSVSEMYTEHSLTMNDGAVPIMAGDERIALVDYKGDAPLRRRYKASSAERDANAAFIVRAVNAHDDLLAALKEAADFIKSQGHNWSAGWENDEHKDAWLKIQAAIRKAEGGA